MRNKKVVPEILDGRRFEIISRYNLHRCSTDIQQFRTFSLSTAPHYLCQLQSRDFLVLLDKSKDRDATVSTMRHFEKKLLLLNPTVLFDLYRLTGET